MVDVASGDHRLLSIRSRGSEDRRFARVEDLLRTGQARYRAEEADAQAKIDKVDSTIAEILKTTKARSLADLPQEVRTKIAQLYADTIPVRKRQREIRRSMREEVERLGRYPYKPQSGQRAGSCFKTPLGARAFQQAAFASSNSTGDEPGIGREDARCTLSNCVCFCPSSRRRRRRGALPRRP